MTRIRAKVMQTGKTLVVSRSRATVVAGPGPSDFRLALDRDPAAKRPFGTLAQSNQRRLVVAIEDAQAPARGQRRLQRPVDPLSEGRA
jgi:uncharacterized protein YdeI (YjbR/CyaY-like superfamily)